VRVFTSGLEEIFVTYLVRWELQFSAAWYRSFWKTPSLTLGFQTQAEDFWVNFRRNRWLARFWTYDGINVGNLWSETGRVLDRWPQLSRPTESTNSRDSSVIQSAARSDTWRDALFNAHRDSAKWLLLWMLAYCILWRHRFSTNYFSCNLVKLKEANPT
jgi:hypothetical protein